MCVCIIHTYIFFICADWICVYFMCLPVHQTGHRAIPSRLWSLRNCPMISDREIRKKPTVAVLIKGGWK